MNRRVREAYKIMARLGLDVIEQCEGTRHHRVRVRGPRGREMWVTLSRGGKGWQDRERRNFEHDLRRWLTGSASSH